MGLLLSVSLFLFVNEWFYLCVFTRLFIIEFLSLFLFVLSVHIWISDLILSLFRKHSPLYSFLFIAVLLFVGSEALLFIACLWVMFSYLCVYSLNGNLFLLNIYFYLAYFAGLLFLFMQVCEYQLLCFYISDSFYASSFYLLTGLHFSH